MSHRTAKLLPIVMIGVLAGAALTLVPIRPAQAEECLSAPKGATPAGGHWRYRVERGTKRHCWYLAEKTATPAPSAAAEPPATAPQRSLADARAEMIAGPAASAPAPASIWPAPETFAVPPADGSANADSTNASTNPGWSLASRWADTGTPADSAASSTTAAPPVDTATPSVVTADAPAPSRWSSQAMLIAGLAAALGVAGLIVRLVIGFAGSQPMPRREQGLHSRPIFDVQIPEMPTPPWLTARPAAPRAPQPTIGDDEAEPPPLNWVRVARARSQADLASDAIEELLAKVSPRPSLGARH